MTTLANPAAAPDAQFFRYNPDEELVYLEDGRPLTNELMREMSEEIEREALPPEAAQAYEKLQARKNTSGLIPGGKSLSGDGKKSPKVEVILSEATHAKVKTAAKAAGMSKSRWLRNLVERELADA